MLARITTVPFTAERPTQTGFAAVLVRAVKTVAMWPLRVYRARQHFAVLNSMSERELSDIGLTRQDVLGTTALGAADDPTTHLASLVEDRRNRRARY